MIKYLPNNDLGDVTIDACATLSPADPTPCATRTLTFMDEHVYYSQLVDNVTLTSDPTDLVIVDTAAVYNTTLYITASGENNAGLPPFALRRLVWARAGQIQPRAIG